MKIEPVFKKFGLQNYTLVDNRVSRLGGEILQLKGPEGVVVFLKTGQGVEAESLEREKNALVWLKNKQLNFPKVIGYFTDENRGKKYLLLSGLDGFPAHKIANLGKEEVVRIAAVALKQFHSISIKGSGGLRTLDEDLGHIKTCIDLDMIKREDFQTANNGKKPEEVYSYLVNTKNKFDHSVITHGDYCLPNLIISQNNYGFIDVGDCGPGDPYKDFSSIEVSIARNFGKKWIPAFYKHYGGINNVDRFKIKYYQLIDQFGYHLDVDKYRKFFKERQSSIGEKN
jgi:aminoglycoside phosphotransferase